MKTNIKLIQGDCLEELKKIPDESINCCVTSPPYWNLRDYKIKPSIWDGDINCEHTWDNFMRKGMTGGTRSNKVQIKGKDNFQKYNKQEQSFCSKCGAWKGSLGLEPTLEDRIIEIELMELKDNLTKEELKEINDYFKLDNKTFI